MSFLKSYVLVTESGTAFISPSELHWLPALDLSCNQSNPLP